MSTTLNIRQLDSCTADNFRRGALARQLTQAQYLEQLVALHIAVRVRADAGDDTAKELLANIGLETVTA